MPQEILGRILCGFPRARFVVVEFGRIETKLCKLTFGELRELQDLCLSPDLRVDLCVFESQRSHCDLHPSLRSSSSLTLISGVLGYCACVTSAHSYRT